MKKVTRRRFKVVNPRINKQNVMKVKDHPLPSLVLTGYYRGRAANVGGLLYVAPKPHPFCYAVSLPRTADEWTLIFPNITTNRFTGVIFDARKQFKILQRFTLIFSRKTPTTHGPPIIGVPVGFVESRFVQIQVGVGEEEDPADVLMRIHCGDAQCVNGQPSRFPANADKTPDFVIEETREAYAAIEVDEDPLDNDYTLEAWTDPANKASATFSINL